MRYFFTIVLTFTSIIVFSQNITQLRTFPAQPTAADTVLVIADLQFNYSSCILDNKYHQINGTTITASTHHCVGIAAAICNTTDTFYLGVLNAGTYNFNLTLSSGRSTSPCSAGIVADDLDTLLFTVQTALGLEDQVLPRFAIFPNPAKDFIELSNAYQQVIKSVRVLNATGALVLEADVKGSNINVSDLTPGIYYLELHHEDGVITEKFVKE